MHGVGFTYVSYALNNDDENTLKVVALHFCHRKTLSKECVVKINYLLFFLKKKKKNDLCKIKEERKRSITQIKKYKNLRGSVI